MDLRVNWLILELLKMLRGLIYLLYLIHTLVTFFTTMTHFMLYMTRAGLLLLTFQKIRLRLNQL
ncbi:hypothetical protein CsatB_006428 [Cannabis sativa]